MRCFIPATDDEIYAFIENYGVDALQPYNVGMRLTARDQLTPPSVEPRARVADQEPRLAA